MERPCQCAKMKCLKRKCITECSANKCCQSAAEWSITIASQDEVTQYRKSNDQLGHGEDYKDYLLLVFWFNCPINKSKIMENESALKM